MGFLRMDNTMRRDGRPNRSPFKRLIAVKHKDSTSYHVVRTAASYRELIEYPGATDVTDDQSAWTAFWKAGGNIPR